MRKRNEIERDVNNAMGTSGDNFFEFQIQKILVEIMLDIRDSLRDLLEARK